MKRTLPVALGALLLLLRPAAADDSLAAMAIGGLVLVKSADIRMASEDLYISPRAVRVRYSFINDSRKDIDAIVAFPLPDWNNFEETDAPTHWGHIAGTGPDLVGFVLTVDGKRAAATLEQRAFLGGRDVTELVAASGVRFIDDQAVPGHVRIAELSPAARQRLLKAGLIAAYGEGAWIAKWTTRTKYWWRQHFPAGKAVTIDHAYTPVTGFEPAIDRAAYCVDRGTESALQSRHLEGGLTTRFVLVTARNWKGPIGRFHLTLDKLKPENVLALCWGPDLKKASPSASRPPGRTLFPRATST